MSPECSSTHLQYISERTFDLMRARRARRHSRRWFVAGQENGRSVRNTSLSGSRSRGHNERLFISSLFMSCLLPRLGIRVLEPLKSILPNLNLLLILLGLSLRLSAYCWKQMWSPWLLGINVRLHTSSDYFISHGLLTCLLSNLTAIYPRCHSYTASVFFHSHNPLRDAVCHLLNIRE